ncbi:MAG: carotenoid biosynthesis protein [Putridiphycobacter sp.]|nr:carotenoid biosynthesis protein [Putridiphycobacter sp.]
MIKIGIYHPLIKPIAIAVIIILHIVGLVGIGFYQSSDILSLTWVNLTITFAIGLLFFENRLKFLVVPLLFAALLGMLAEGIGVQTGYLFGNYAYGKVLGLKIFEVPFTIGLLWAGLNISAKNFAGRFVKNIWLKSVVAATLMVIFDVLMEPVAIALGFWHWHQNEIPIFNYITWFFVSLIIQISWRKLNTKNAVFDSIFIIQTLFFIGLNFLI